MDQIYTSEMTVTYFEDMDQVYTSEMTVTYFEDMDQVSRVRIPHLDGEITDSRYDK
jgi:hypothetical protein